MKITLTSVREPGATSSVSLKLRYHDKVVRLDETSATLILGRGKKADVVINDTMASREHARVECRRDKFVLTDQSTNGTYIVTADGTTYLRREETTLTGVGKISFGRELADTEEVGVVFLASWLKRETRVGCGSARFSD